MKSLLAALLPALLLVVLFSCRMELDPSLSLTTIRIKVGFDESLSALSPQGVSVLLRDVQTGEEWTGTTDGSGTVQFPDRIGGNYTVKARRSIPAAEFEGLTGFPVSADVVLEDSLVKKEFSMTAGSDGEIRLMSSVGGWVVRQVYYAGSDTLNGAGLRDQFFEITNNSTRTMYADSLYIGLLQGVKTKDLTSPYVLPASGQFDWSQAVNMPSASKPAANTDYVYAHTVVMIPGTGMQYKVEPGKTLLIARNAQNHKTGYAGTDGKMLTTKNPALTVDLSKADFEAYFQGKVVTDVDNASVPNLSVIYSAAQDFTLSADGKEAIVLFKTTQDVAKWGKYAVPTTRTVTASTALNVQIPLGFVLSGVEILTSSTIPKKLPASIDAGFYAVPKGIYSSQSIVRKARKTVGTRVILTATGNAQQDFDYLNVALPGGSK